MLLIIAILFSSLTYCAQPATAQQVAAQQIPLPQAFAAKAVYHIKVAQLDGYSCGYNALFNACNLEQLFGVHNQCSQYPKFDAVCKQYLKPLRQNPKDASSNKILEDLAPQLGLKNFHYLSITDDLGIAPIQSSNVRIQWQGKISNSQKEELFLKAKKKKMGDIIAQINQQLSDAYSTCMIHFGCHVYSKGDHGILITLVQFPNKTRALFVCDNLNEQIHDNSDAKKHIDFLCKTFKVIGKPHHLAMKEIPHIWPSLVALYGKQKQRERAYYYYY